jgi:hypothetical protein
MYFSNRTNCEIPQFKFSSISLSSFYLTQILKITFEASLLVYGMKICSQRELKVGFGLGERSVAD